MSNSSSFDFLEEARLGGLPYRNALPLQFGLQPAPRLLTPSEAAERLESGDLDAALLPLPAAFELASCSKVVAGVGISASGPVYSVVVAYKGNWADVTKIVLDPASRSSVVLLSVLLGEYGIRNSGCGLLEECSAEVANDASVGQLMIGDPAIAFRQNAGPEWEFLDLSGEWEVQTGLPFVFALWVIRSDYPHGLQLAEYLRALCGRNLADPEKWMPEDGDPGFWNAYFSALNYGTGELELSAIKKFRALATKHGLLERGSELTYF